ncbi:MAG: hypothetical protein ACXWC4_04870 [Telluria sp.]
MDQTSSQNTADLAIADGNNLRQDLRQHEIVEHGILMREHGSTMAAIEYLRMRDVAPHVIRRVLLEPHLRRRSS